jgi:GH24 family phage-related lysozyme (muramidase)
MKKITTRVALEVAHHEAVIRQAYKDSVGKWTWSVGLTNASGHNVERYIDSPQPLSKCLEVFVWALERYAEDVREVFSGYDLTEEQFAAALSFHWNTGAIKRASWVKHWKSGDYRTARKRFMDWKRPPEIEERRKAERDLFFVGVWHNQGTMPEYTRVHSNHTPDWSSRVERDVSATLRNLLEPSAVTPAKQPSGILGAILAALRAIFGGKS